MFFGVNPQTVGVNPSQPDQTDCLSLFLKKIYSSCFYGPSNLKLRSCLSSYITSDLCGRREGICVGSQDGHPPAVPPSCRVSSDLILPSSEGRKAGRQSVPKEHWLPRPDLEWKSQTGGSCGKSGTVVCFVGAVFCLGEKKSIFKNQISHKKV